MNKNRTNLYAPNATTQTAPMNRTVNLLPGPDTMDLTKGDIRHLRKLVAKGKVARTCLPITADSNNRLFPYLGKLNDAEIEPIYHGHPFTILAPAPVILTETKLDGYKSRSSPVIPATIVDMNADVPAAVFEVKKAKKPAAKKPVVKVTVNGEPVKVPKKTTKKPVAK